MHLARGLQMTGTSIIQSSFIMPSFLHLTPSQPMTSLTQCMDKGFFLPSSKTISSWNCITQPPCLIKLVYSLYHHPMLQLGYLQYPHPTLSNEFQIALEWWLGIDVSEGSTCVYCTNHSLDHLANMVVMWLHTTTD